MKSLPVLPRPFALSAIAAVALACSGSQSAAQSANSGKAAKASSGKASAAKTSAKSAAKSAAPTKFDQHLAAHLKFFRVLSHYAEALSEAKDAATAHEAAKKLAEITREAVTAGEEIVKLGKPEPEIEAKLATNADLKMTSQTVAEQTRAAVKALADNAEVKTILAPAVEEFQAALNQVQQAADEPPAEPSAPPAVETAKTKDSPQQASEATAVPPPPQ
jgi:hypothetical protein